jgi:quinol monooxygenase YgiN
MFRLAISLIASLLVTESSPAQEKDQPNSIEAAVKASLKDPTKPFVMYVHVKIKDGSAEKFEKAFVKARAATRKEKGVKSYNLTRSATAPNQYIVYERWENFAALQEHMKTKHFAALLVEVGAMFDGQPEVRVFIPVREEKQK